MALAKKHKILTAAIVLREMGHVSTESAGATLVQAHNQGVLMRVGAGKYTLPNAPSAIGALVKGALAAKPQGTTTRLLALTGTIDGDRAAKATGLSREAVLKYLSQLAGKGLFKRTGKAQYAVAKPGAPKNSAAAAHPG